ncbi:Carbohydrate binding domain protein [compost metagenome]
MVTDYSDFSNENWNGWGGTTHFPMMAIRVEQDGNSYVRRKDLTNQPITGAFMEKTFNGLEINQHYIVSFRARYNGEGRFYEPELSVETDSALRLAGPWRLNASNTVWGVYYGRFTANATSMKVHLVTRDRPVPGGEPVVGGDFSVDDVRVGPELADLTDFSSGFNHWVLQPSAVGATIVFDSEGNHSLVFPTPNAHTAGDILQRRFEHLVPGARYRFSFKGRTTNTHPTKALLSVICTQQDATVLIPPSRIGSAQWQLFSGVFQATQASVLVTLKNDEPSGLGNDFALDDLELREEFPDIPPGHF